MNTKIQKANVEDIFELNGIQKGILFHYLNEPERNLYNAQLVLKVDGDFSKDILFAALSALQVANEGLRSVFNWQMSNPVQIVLKNCSADFTFHDLTKLDDVEKSEFVSQQSFLDRQQRFDLGKLPFRLTVIKNSEVSYVLFITHHHILYDGWSTGIVIKELFVNYFALRRGRNVNIIGKTRYKDLLNARRNSLSPDEHDFWRRYLEGYELVSTFPTQISLAGSSSNKVNLSLPILGIDGLAREYKVTKAAIVYTVFGLIMQRMNATNDVVFGVTVSDRNLEVSGIEAVIGNFINTIPLRVKSDPFHTVADTLMNVHRDMIDLNRFSGTSYLSIKKVLQLTPNESLWDAIVVIENYPLDEKSINCNDEFRVHLDSVYENTGIPLVINVFFKEELQIEFVYQDSIVELQNVLNLSAYFKMSIEQLAGAMTEPIRSMSLLSDDQREKIVVDFNSTEVNYGDDLTIVRLFESQVIRSWDSIACECGSDVMSYGELSERSSRFANYLRLELGVASGELVGVNLEREMHLLPVILGILKAGACYVPIDSSYPLERKKFIIEDALVKVVVTRSSIGLPALGDEVKVVDLDQKLPVIDSYQTLDHASVLIGTSSLAYVLYTSGSTGKPKGVMIEHGSVANYILWASDFYGRGSYALYSSISFDLTVTSLFAPLVNGDRIIIYKEEGTVSVIERVIKDNLSEIVKLTPSHLKIIRGMDLPAGVSRVKKFIVGGEDLEGGLAEQIQEKFKETTIYNEYGPTETTVGCMIYKYDGCSTVSVPIGVPISNTQVYLLDGEGNLVPEGIVGELYVSGAGVGRGYLHRDDLTGERFVANPFREGKRMYRTGDQGKRLSNGNLIYLGRQDEQVKISGYRIELGEIEHQLLGHESISECAVVAREINTTKALVAYYSGAVKVDPWSLRDYLLKTLPPYYVPSYYVFLETLPTSSNGKLDRRSLPAPEVAQVGSFETPRNEKESLLKELWFKILGVENISTTDNFFTLGGDSIKSIQLSSKLHSLGFDISVKDIFENPTIKKLSPRLKKADVMIDQARVIGRAPLTPIQRWFFDNTGMDRHHFNQSAILRFELGLSLEWTQMIFQKIMDHHDALRMVFRQSEVDVVQENTDTQLPVSICEYTLNADDDVTLMQEKIDEIQGTLNLIRGPLMKVALFHYRQVSFVLLVVHHLVVDGVSWRILLEDIDTLCQQIKMHAALSLPRKTNSFLSWSLHLSDYIKGECFEKGRRYWRDLKGEMVRIPRDFHCSENLFKDHLVATCRLDKSETTKLVTNAHRAFSTQTDDLLLTALLLAMNRVYGAKSLLVHMERHGRDGIDTELNINRTVGWFTTIHPVLVRREAGELADIIKGVKENLRNVPNKGFDFLLMDDHHLPGNTCKEMRSAQVSFNYLGQLDSEFSFFSVVNDLHTQEVSPEIRQDYDWNVIAALVDAQLQIQIHYSRKQYRPETVALVLQTYKEALNEIIGYCSSFEQVQLTPSDLIHRSISAEQLDRVQRKYAVENIYPLAQMQEGILFHALRDAGSKAYFEQKTLSIIGRLDIEAVQKSFGKIVARYDALRSIFLHEGFDYPVQVVLRDPQFQFKFKDIQQECRESTVEQVVKRYQIDDRNAGFDLNRGVLMRALVLRISDQEYKLVWSHHHIVMDGWSTNIIWGDFKAFYLSHVDNSPLALPPSRDYGRYVRWLNERKVDHSLDYWAGYLKGYDRLSSLIAMDGNAPEKSIYDLRSELIVLNRLQTGALQKASRQSEVTLNAILQAAWGILLSKYNNVQDVVFGSVVSGRPAQLEHVEKMVGLFINTIPVRVRYEDETIVYDVLHQMQADMALGESHQMASLSEIQSGSELGRRLFDHIVAFENFPVTYELDGVATQSIDAGFRINDVEVFGQTNYDAALVIIPGEEIQVRLDYNANKSQQRYIQRILSSYQTIVAQIISNPKMKISDLEILPDAERFESMAGLDNTSVVFPEHSTIVDLFARQVAHTPDRIAVKYEGQTITYAQLDVESSRVARCLKANGIEGNEVVGLLMDRSIDTIVGMLGILKAGGAYLPIDVDYPDDRKVYLVKDSGATKVVSCRKFHIDLGSRVTFIFMEDVAMSAVTNDVQTIVISPTDLCYVIYTSGTTGNPKGVMVEHRNLVRLFFNDEMQFDFHQDDVWTMFHSHCFDFSVWEIYGALLFGGKLVVVSKLNAIDTSAYLRILKEEEVTVLNQTPTAFYNLMRAESLSSEISLKLRLVVFGGEALAPGKLSLWYQRYPGVKLVNMFGITETTVHVTYKEIGQREIDYNISNVGKPIPTLSIYVLDKYMKMVPKGVIGELYVGGAGVSRGYLNKDNLTREKFISNPFKKNERLYRSGDLGRILESGDVEYIGRMDNQIQLRGFRVELGEIEHQLCKIPGIQESIVVVSQVNGDALLVAYYVSEKELPDVRNILINKLPDYMVPSFYVQLNSLPLTSNGKLDKKALPIPEAKSVEIWKPKNQVQKELLDIWSDILDIGTDKIGINTNFFDMGGNSLKLVKMVEKIRVRFAIPFTVGDAFSYPKLSDQSDYISGGLAKDFQGADSEDDDMVDTRLRIIQELEEG